MRNPKNPGIDFYRGFSKKSQEGGAIRNPKNPGIDFDRGFRKMSQRGGGGVQFKILPPP